MIKQMQVLLRKVNPVYLIHLKLSAFGLSDLTVYSLLAQGINSHPLFHFRWNHEIIPF